MILNKVTGETLAWNCNGPAGHIPELCSGEKDKCGCIHSEVNTLLVASDTKKCSKFRTAVMVATRAPCVPCASAIINAGYIGDFIYLDKSEPGDEGLALLERFGINVVHHDDGKSQQQLRSSAAVAPSPGRTLLVANEVFCLTCNTVTVKGMKCPHCGRYA